MGETSDVPEDPLERLYRWIEFGAGLARLYRAGMVNPDLHRDNIRWLNGRLNMIDYGDMMDVSYPADVKPTGMALASLLRWLDERQTSAVRFGFLHEGGAPAAHVIAYLRETQGLSPLPSEVTQDISKRPPELKERQPVDTASSTWEEWRDTHEEASLLSNPPLTIFRDWSERRADTTKPRYGDRHYAEAQVCAGLREQQFGAVIEAMLNLQRYAVARKRPVLAAGYALFLENVVSDQSTRLGETTSRDVSAVIDHVDEDIVETLHLVDQEVSGLETVWPFYWLWCVDEVRAGAFAPEE